MEEITGKISSLESMGLVDGPGIRYVVFLQGCSLRCKYCHNPETWNAGGERLEISPDALIEKIKRYKSYFGKEGGVTFSGGEPLLQPQFLKKCLTLCRQEGINTAIDTAGVGASDEKMLKEILAFSNLVILDIKHTDREKYKELTGRDIDRFLSFLKICQEVDAKLWLRQVIVPGLNDNEDNIERLAQFIAPLKNVERVELLPYKNLGEVKYRTLGIRYPLEGLPNMNEEKCRLLEASLREKIKKLKT